MSTRCEDVSDRLLELLYDELPADERAALEAHVAGCERCRAEVASFQKTRAVARSVLSEPAPAGVRQRLLAAALASAPAAKPARVEEKSAGIGAWLRQHWTLPTLATVGAMAVFLLASRVFLNPEKTYERGQAVTAAPSPAAPAPVAAPSAAKEEPSVAFGGGARGGALGGGSLASRSASAKDTGAAAGPRPHVSLRQLAASTDAAKRDNVAAPPRPAPTSVAPAKRKAASDDLLDGLAADKPDHLGKGKGKGEAADRAFEGTTSGGASAGVPRAELHRLVPTAKPAPLAQPFPGAEEQEPRREAAPAPPPVAVEAHAAAARPAAPVSDEQVRANRARADADAEVAPVEKKVSRASSSTSSAPAGGRAVAEPLPQRAERLFKEGHWSEAASAFEQLLRQFPQNPSAPHWRQRLSAARAAAEAATTPPSP